MLKLFVTTTPCLRLVIAWVPCLSRDARFSSPARITSVISPARPTVTVAFGIADQKATESAFPKNLTYFAKLNFVRAAQQIKGLEYKVVLCPIEIT
jgi:hypothetical protein